MQENETSAGRAGLARAPYLRERVNDAEKPSKHEDFSALRVKALQRRVQGREVRLGHELAAEARQEGVVDKGFKVEAVSRPCLNHHSIGALCTAPGLFPMKDVQSVGKPMGGSGAWKDWIWCDMLHYKAELIYKALAPPACSRLDHLG
jgi:hypothetical protein